MPPAHFGPNFHGALHDYADAVLLYVFASALVAFGLGTPGTRFVERLGSFCSILISWTIGATIVALIVTRQWESGQVRAELPAADPRAPHRLQHRPVLIRLDVGLAGINITMASHSDSKNLTGGFHFNEQFDWAWDQGRDGFGPFAGPFHRQFRQAQRRGYPHAILSAADVFVLDGEGIRFGRWYRQAGWHARNLIWISLGCWVVANLCLQLSLAPAARLWALTGILLISAALVWLWFSPVLRVVRPVISCGHRDLVLSLGLTFYACVAAGAVSLLIGAALFWLDARHPLAAASFFGLDPLIGYDECYCSPEEPVPLSTSQNERSLSDRLRRLSLRIRSRSGRQRMELETGGPSQMSLDEAVDETSESLGSSTTKLPAKVSRDGASSQVLVLRRRSSTRFHDPNQSVIRRGHPTFPSTLPEEDFATVHH